MQKHQQKTGREEGVEIQLCAEAGSWERAGGGRAARCPPLPCISLHMMLMACVSSDTVKKTQKNLTAAAPDFLAGCCWWRAASGPVPWLSSCRVWLTFYLPGSFCLEVGMAPTCFCLFFFREDIKHFLHA